MTEPPSFPLPNWHRRHVCLLVALLLVLYAAALLLVTSFVQSVQAGHVGQISDIRTGRTTVVDPGLYFVNPLTKTFTETLPQR